MPKLDPLEPANKVVFARNNLGVATRRADPEAVAAARQNLAAAKLEAYIAKVVAEAPPLDQSQLDAIAVLLRPVPADKPASGGDAV
ncbi:hypothetical protein [Pseudarthrobacter sulfonivorans]|uniref:hypothetical protein n=1 Tax=Pseudarthrobacter sulfonivorans TaxID=121292 RepID=UPI00285FE73F|nr:hypothetical protein [Pseudarthrobacter sulfonivorans]MDR6414062.1 hypothetical protein [Pseudarthrobacter sulfonivorans]